MKLNFIIKGSLSSNLRKLSFITLKFPLMIVTFLHSPVSKNHKEKIGKVAKIAKHMQ